MNKHTTATLIANIGTVVTRVLLVDEADGDARVVSTVEVFSTVEPPEENACAAILHAAAEISARTGRNLLNQDQLLMPQTAERDGVDQLVVVTSAAGLLNIVIAAVAENISGRSLERATRSNYTTVLQKIALDTNKRIDDKQGTTWIERQVQTLTGLQPDVVLMAGGLVDGAKESLVRLAHIVGLTSLGARVDDDGIQHHSVRARHVVFAGNHSASEAVMEALSGRARLRIVDNIRPALDIENLNPTRQEIAHLYDELILSTLPGMRELRRLSNQPVRTTAAASGIMTRFLAELNKRQVLAFDVGAASTMVHYAAPQQFTPVVLGQLGVSLGAGEILAQVGAAKIATWLPFPISERELSHRILNIMLRPQIAPITQEDTFISLALTREALHLAQTVLEDEHPNPAYDLLIASGAALTHIDPGLAALALLDGLQPLGQQSVLAIDLHLDMLGLMAAGGAMIFAQPEAALTMFEQDLLHNTPLATCIVLNGEEQLGATAAEIELRIEGGETRRIQVAYGQIGRIPVNQGERAQLIVRPTARMRVGTNAPGTEAASPIAAIHESTLGVIIDARGRPLSLPSAQAERQQRIWEWMTALGAVSGPLPYETTPAPVDEIPTMVSFLPAGQMPAPGVSPAAPLNDLASLRQTVEAPKKRGLFGKK